MKVKQFAAPALIGAAVLVYSAATQIYDFSLPASSASGMSVADTLRGNGKIVLGYWTDWGNLAAENIPWGSVTHINYAFARCSPDGSLSGYNPYKVNELVSARNRNDPNVKLLLSVGGGEWSVGGEYFTGLMDAGEQAWEAFALNCVSFLQTYGFDGIDIDYESPSSHWEGSKESDYANYVAFLDVVDRTLDAENKGYLLTEAGSGTNWTLTGMGTEHLRYFDFINIMTYDFHGSWNDHSGYNSALYDGFHNCQNDFLPPDPPSFNADWAVNYYLNVCRFPAEKIVMGVPYYGYKWEGSSELGGKGTGGTVTLAEMKQLLAQNPSAEKWDDSAKVPYAVINNTFYTYENARSIQEKTDYIVSKGLAGYMTWQLAGEENGEFTKLAANTIYRSVGGIPDESSGDSSDTVSQPPSTPDTGNFKEFNWVTEYFVGDFIDYNGVIYIVTKQGMALTYPNEKNNGWCEIYEEIPEVIKGDTDMSGIVDSGDAVYLKRGLTGWNGYYLRNETAELNGDEYVNIADLVWLKRHLAEWQGYELN